MFAWVDGDNIKRANESSDDAYREFHKMLEFGHPPDTWSQLLADTKAEGQCL